MPRTARIKSFDSMYHIIVRSISDTLLYKDDSDKDKYLKLFKKYQDTFHFRVYAYCIMDNHAHFIVDPMVADISKIMHGINQSYAQYFNRAYNRHGHLFQDRFKSIIITDDGYLLRLSAYIHTNPEDIRGYSNCVQKYPYSSLGILLGLREDNLKLVDRGFILQVICKDIIKARHMYRGIIKNCDDFEMKKKSELTDLGSQYRSERFILLRNYKEDDIVTAVSKATGIRKTSIHIKHSHDTTEFRAVAVFLMRCFCNYKGKDISKILGSISQSRISTLGAMGQKKVYENQKYKDMIIELTEGRAIAF